MNNKENRNFLFDYEKKKFYCQEEKDNALIFACINYYYIFCVYFACWLKLIH